MENSKDRLAVLNDEEDTIDLLDLAFYLRSKLLYIIAVFILGGVIAGAYTKFMVTPLYTATAKMYIVSASSNAAVNLSDLNLGTTLSKDYQELLRIHAIYDNVMEELDLEEMTYEDLDEIVEIGPVSDTRILKVSVTDPDPEQAANIANEIVIQGQKLLPKLMDIPNPTIAEEALIPERKSSPSYSKNIILGALALSVLLIAVFVVMYLMDDTLKSAEDVEKYFGILPLAVIPEGDLPTISDEAEKRSRKRKSKKGDMYYGG